MPELPARQPGDPAGQKLGLATAQLHLLEQMLSQHSTVVSENHTQVLVAPEGSPSLTLC